MQSFGPKNILNLLLKYDDYETAVEMVETLKMDKKYIVEIYENWIETLIQRSTKDDHLIHDLIEDKLHELRI